MEQEQLLAHLNDVTTRMTQLSAQETVENVTQSTPSTPPMPPGGVDINAMLNKIKENPQMMGEVMDKIPNVISPEMMEQVKKMVPGGMNSNNARNMINQLQSSGIDPQAMRSQMVQKQNKARGMVSHNDNTQTVILLTLNKQIKVREFMKNEMMESAAANLKIASPRDSECSVMAQGLFKGKKVRIFYNPTEKAINKRAKKLVGFPIGGDVIFYLEDENMTEEDFLKVENYIIAP